MNSFLVLKTVHHTPLLIPKLPCLLHPALSTGEKPFWLFIYKGLNYQPRFYTDQAGEKHPKGLSVSFSVKAAWTMGKQGQPLLNTRCYIWAPPSRREQTAPKYVQINEWRTRLRKSGVLLSVKFMFLPRSPHTQRGTFWASTLFWFATTAKTFSMADWVLYNSRPFCEIGEQHWTQLQRKDPSAIGNLTTETVHGEIQGLRPRTWTLQEFFFK